MQSTEAPMTFRRVVTVLGLAVTLILATSLQAKTVTLGSSDNRTDVSLNLGDTLLVEFYSGDVNGFGWVSHLPKGSGLTALNDDPQSTNKKAVTRTQTKRFRFNAAKVGDFALVFGFE